METVMNNLTGYQLKQAASNMSPILANECLSPLKKSEMDADSLRLLEPGHMLNDIVVEQYMQHVLNHLEPRLRDKVHLFSSFFYGRLKNLYLNTNDDGPGLEHLAKRWDKHVELMNKDYLVIPVCDCIHWTLVIICFAHKAIMSSDCDYGRGEEEDEDDDDDDDYDEICPPRLTKHQHENNEACLIVFDSLGHRLLEDFTEPIRFFLKKRWQYERPNVPAPDFMSRGVLLERAAQVPRQRNFYDCGVYLLHFFETFLASPQTYYKKILDFQSLLDHFAIDPLLKRNLIGMVFITSPEKSYS